MPDAPGMNPLCWASAPCAPGWGGDSWGPNWTSQGLICLSGWDKPCIRLCAQPGDAAQGPPNPRRMAGGWGRDTAWGRGSGPTGRGLGVAMAGRREGTGVGDGTGQEGSGDFSPVGFSTRERASKGLPTWRPDDLGTPPAPPRHSCHGDCCPFNSFISTHFKCVSPTPSFTEIRIPVANCLPPGTLKTRLELIQI